VKRLLALPVVLMLAVLLLWPLGILVARSVSGDPAGLTLEHYLAALTSRIYVTAFANTALIAFASTVLALAICLPAALYIEGVGEQPPTRKTYLAAAMTLPLSLPGVVIGFFVILLFGLTGFVPQLFEVFFGERRFNIAYTFWGMLLGYLYFQIPRATLVLRAAATLVSSDAVDAARTLGASTARVYWAIVLPAMRPALINAAALSLATAFGAFGTAATLSRGYRVAPLEIASAFTESFQPELAAALSIVLALVTTALLLGVGGAGERSMRVQRSTKPAPDASA
jgi:putative spermidine/putrescine transport system permease protein